MVLETARGAVTLRPETAGDAAFLADLFATTLHPALLAVPALAATQLRAREGGYRGAYPGARFDILEIDGAACGRLVLDVPPDGADATIVDYALLPAARGGGLGRAVLAAVLACLAPHGQAVCATALSTNAASLRMLRALGFVAADDDAIPFVALRWTPRSGHGPEVSQVST